MTKKYYKLIPKEVNGKLQFENLKDLFYSIPENSVFIKPIRIRCVLEDLNNFEIPSCDIDTFYSILDVVISEELDTITNLQYRNFTLVKNGDSYDIRFGTEYIGSMNIELFNRIRDIEYITDTLDALIDRAI